jgi:putative transposase
MIEPGPEVSVRRQCELLSVGRSGLYYEAVPQDAEELEVMRRIDEIHLKWPFYGSRKVSRELRVNRKRVQRLMRLMGLEGMAPKPNTSRSAPEHPVFPYLLRKLDVTRANQVWAADITYVPLAHGFAYLVAVIDWYSRRVLSWRLSNSMDTSFCVEALEEALERFGKPEIFNTDQGSQFTAQAFVDVLRAADVLISMDGKGRCIDNVFVERLWRSLKYEDVYLYAYDGLGEARGGIGRYFTFFNEKRPHQSLGYQTPDAIYRTSMDEVRRASPTRGRRTTNEGRISLTRK